jgi:hypothetical protein
MITHETQYARKQPNVTLGPDNQPAAERFAKLVTRGAIVRIAGLRSDLS